MNRIAIAVLSLFIAAPLSAQFGIGAQSGIEGADAGPKATIEGSIQKRTGDEIEGSVVVTIAEGWHVNSNTPGEEFAIPTVLSLDSAAASLIDARYPPHAMKAFEFTGGKSLAVYDGKFVISFRAKLAGAAEKLTATLRYQACSDRVCLPPNTATADIDVVNLKPAPVVAAAAPAAQGGGFTPLTEAPPTGSRSLLSSDVSGTLAARGLPVTLIAIFLLGLALNLTPCVYPLIPITIGYFSQQSGSSTARRTALSSAYVLGIAITYSALGVFSALSGKLFGAWLQHPGVLIFVAALMLIMASSMFGLFEMQAPKFISNRSGGQSGILGALTMGLVIGIVAAPCVGPFVISLIALVSSLQSPMLGFLMFFVLALGLGLPYLFLGIFSSAVTSIPRSGMWMILVKKAMGFILIAMAFYFLRPLIGDLAFQYGVAGSLLVGAAFLFFSKSPGANVWRIAISVLLLVAGAAFAIPHDRTGGVQWQKYDPKLLAEAKAAGKPVVIDFYADWCLPCKELDAKTFSDPRVVSALDDVVRLKADLTSPENPQTKALTAEYGILGVPTIVFIDGTGAEVRSARLTGFEEPDAFLGRVAKVN